MIRILIAEDQAMVRGALSSLLALEDDIEVVSEVGRGDAVLDAARSGHVDVALLDIEMPGQDGISAAAELARELPETRTLILTTFGRPGYLRRAIESGASGFVLKDAPAEQLAEAVREVNAGRRVIDPAWRPMRSPTVSAPSPSASATSLPPPAGTRRLPRSRRSCTSQKGRCGTISAPRSESWEHATAPRRSASPKPKAGSTSRRAPSRRRRGSAAARSP